MTIKSSGPTHQRKPVMPPFTKTAIALGITALLTHGGSASAQEMPAEEPAQTLEPVTVTESLSSPYQADKLDSPKYTQSLLETPQTITVLTDSLLQEQGVVSLRDALRNVTGISIQAGEGNPPSGDQLKIRGFSSRDDILVDNIRDVGFYFRDPFNVEQVEVAKGPSSAAAGRGSTGGTINMVSKAPKAEAIRELEAGIGTDSLYRLAADINQPLSALPGSALRVNLMAHDEARPGRDEVENRRFGIAPSFAMGLGTATRFTASLFYTEQDTLPDSGLPNARNATLAGSGFEGRVAPVDPSNFYGHTSDYQDLQAYSGTLKLEQDFSAAFSWRNLLRYGRTHSDAIFSSPRFSPGTVTTLDGTTLVVGNQKPRDQVSDIVIGQSDVTLRFTTGSLPHTLVAGVEVARETNDNRRRLDANGPTTNLFAPTPRAAAPIAYNGTRAQLDLDTVAAYVGDNIELTPQWELNAGARFDRVETQVKALNDGGVPAYTQDLSRHDTEWSGNLGLVYKPAPNTSVYAGIGSSFDPTGRADLVQLAGGNNNLPITPGAFDVKPERSLSYEIGSKTNLLEDRLQLAAALFRTEKTNGRTPGNPGEPPVVLNGELRVEGVELSISGRPTDKLNVFAGYTYQDGRVTHSNTAFEVGQRLDNTPNNNLSGWLTYQVLPALTAGGGVQYVDSRTSNIRPSAASDFVITADEYVVLDAVAAYRVDPRLTLRLNAYNLMDEEYTFELSSGQSIPGITRTFALTALLSF